MSLDRNNIYVIELEQPYVNYYAKVVEDKGELLVVQKYDDDGVLNPTQHVISRKQIQEINNYFIRNK